MALKTAADHQRIYIAVIGPTGSGKSTFIETAVSLESIRVGPDLKLYTTSVQLYKPGICTFSHENYEITLIDTPGYNDTIQSKSAVLSNLSNWLTATCKEQGIPSIKLSGIIYVQAVRDGKIDGFDILHSERLQELCGPGYPMNKVLLTTTGWDMAIKAGDHSKDIAHESELGQDLAIRPLIRLGVRVAKFDGTRDSAMQIILSLIDRPESVQDVKPEMVDEDWESIDAFPGHGLHEELKRLEERHRQEMTDIRKEIEESRIAHEAEMKETLAQSLRKVERQREETRKAHDLLEYERRNERRRQENDMQSLRLHLQKQRDDDWDEGSDEHDTDHHRPTEKMGNPSRHKQGGAKMEENGEFYGKEWQTCTPPPEYDCN